VFYPFGSNRNATRLSRTSSTSASESEHRVADEFVAAAWGDFALLGPRLRLQDDLQFPIAPSQAMAPRAAL